MLRSLAFLLALPLLACRGGSDSPPVAFWAGVASIDLTPSRNVPLGGYSGRQGKPLVGVHDPVQGKALWLETPESRVCIVTTDLIGSSLEIRDRIRPSDASIILTASHTHSGPGALKSGFWELALGKFDPDFLEEVVEKLKRVVDEARAARRPAGISFGSDRVEGLSRNRRSKDGPVDPELNVLIVRDELARPMAVLANFSAHATVIGEKSFLVSADWPGAFQRALESRTGGTTLFTNGAEGDVAPRAPGGRDAFEKAEALGEALAARAANLVGGIAKSTGQVRMSYVERGVDLPSPTLPAAPKTSVVGLLEINGTRMFCVPGEPAVELGLELKRRFPGSWILGLANDHLGYFLTEAEYAKGGYERLVSFYGPSMGPWLVDQLARLGGGEHAPDRPGQPEGGGGEDHHRR
jgi:hypothetical protein